MVNAGAIVCTSLIKVRCSYRSQLKIEFGDGDS